MEEFNLKEFLERLDTEPSVLFVGENFDTQADENQKVIQLAWNTVITSQRKNDFAENFIVNNNRLVHQITDVTAINNRVFDKSNLSIIRLFSTDESDLHPEDYQYSLSAQVTAYSLFNHVTEMLKTSGLLVVVGFSTEDRFKFSRFMDICAVFHKNGIIIFDCDNEEKKELENLAEDNHIILESQSLANFINFSDDDLYDDYYDEYTNDEYEHIYIERNLCGIDKKELQEIQKIAIPVTYEEINKVHVESYLTQGYFYQFLKNSPYSPQWYGYSEKFNIVHSYEKQLYKKTKFFLDNPGKVVSKPICLAGQSGAGKSIALANLAYKIYNEKQYPILFLQNKDITFSFEEVQIREAKKFENYLSTLKNLGARSVLIILDISVYGEASRNWCVQLFKYLSEQRGYNITLVFSSYEFEPQKESENFFKINADPNLMPDSNEEKEFRNILSKKGGLSETQVSTIASAIYNEKDASGKNACKLMTLLYRLIVDIRPNFEKGIRREAETSIQEILKLAEEDDDNQFIRSNVAQAFYEAFKDKKEQKYFIYYETNLKGNTKNINIRTDIQDLLTTVAFCSKYGFAVPSNLAYRLLPNTNYRYLQMVAKVPFFVFRNLENGDFEFLIRTRIEAEMLLKAFKTNFEDEVCILLKMIDALKESMSYSNISEVNLVVNLLKLLGPNSNEYGTQKIPSDDYDKIINSLRSLRENNNVVNPRLILQEIVYIREYTKYQYKRHRISQKELSNYLKEAIDTGTTVVIELSQINSNNFLRDVLLVEVTMSKLLIFKNTDAIDRVELKTMAQDCLQVIQHNPENSYAYTALFETAILLFYNSATDLDNTSIFITCCELIDLLREEYSEIANQDAVLESSVKLMECLDKVELNEQYFKKMLENGSDAGIYFKVHRKLKEEKINLYHTENPFTVEQVNVCKEIVSFMDREEYKTIISQSVICQQLLVLLNWIIFDREPVFQQEKSYTYITVSGWHKLLEICKNYENLIYCEEENYYNSIAVFYIMALCYAQLEKYEECLKICNKIRNRTELFSFKNRIRVHHILCDFNGHPSEFGGTFVKQTMPNEINGYVQIDKIPSSIIPWLSKTNPNTGIYYHRANMSKNTKREAGQSYSDFQLGLGYMGFSVFRGLKNNREKR